MAKTEPLRAGRVSLDEARDRLRRGLGPVAPSEVALPHCAGLALAEDVVCRDALPTAEISLRDGYAVASGEAPAPLRCLGIALPGRAFAGVVGPGECVQTATGAVLPAGADAVAPQEHCSVEGDEVAVHRWPEAGRLVQQEGSEAEPGRLLLSAGTVLGPDEVETLASAGRLWVKVRRPRLGIVATGNELVAVGDSVGPGQRRESNRWYLAAAVRAAGAEVVLTVRVSDDVQALEAASAAWGACDLVVTTGGAGPGPRDAVRQFLEAAADLRFSGVDIRPGAGTLFAMLKGTPVLALPGRTEAMKNAWRQLGTCALDRLRGVTEGDS